MTSKRRNIVIVAVVVVLVIGICCAATFIGLEYADGNGGETVTETEKAKETEKETEKESETEHIPCEPQLTSFHGIRVEEVTEENLKKYESNMYSKHIYDYSVTEYTFDMLLIVESDISEFSFNNLIWNEELMVEREEQRGTLISLKKDQCIHVKLDSVEIIGYLGISFVNDGELYRCYPATSGKDGSAILVEIDDRLLPDTYREIPADQRHIGGWSQGGFNLAIYKVLDGEIAFVIDQYKGFDYRAIAVLRDGEYVFGHNISPYTDFSDYYGNRDDSGITGKLVFGEASVTVIADGQFFFNEGLNFTCTSSVVHGGSVGLSKADDYLTEWKSYPEAVYTTDESIENLLVEKGWFDILSYDRKNISSVCGDPNGIYKWGIELSPYDSEYKTPYYTVVGDKGSISVAIRFAYDSETDTCSVVDVYYADRFGNLLSGDELLGVTGGKTGLEAVLDPSDPALVGFFDSKGAAEKLDGERFEGEENYTSSISPEKLAAMEDFAKENTVIPEELPKFSNEEIFVGPYEWVSGRYKSEYLPSKGLKEYRYSYFAEPTFLYPLVGVDAVREWYDKVIAADCANNAVPEEMYTLSFVKYFEIPKDKFIEAQNEYRAKTLPLLKSYGISVTDENYEEISADIIYTFDKEIIDNYHIRIHTGMTYRKAEVKYEHTLKSKTDVRYKFICAWVHNDYATLVQLCGSNITFPEYEPGINLPLTSIGISSYEVREDENDKNTLYFDFVIAASDVKSFPVGEYSMAITTNSPFTLGITYTQRPGTYSMTDVDEDEKFFAETIFGSWYDSDFDKVIGHETSLALFYLYKWVNGIEFGDGLTQLTMEELVEITREVYNDPDFEVNTWPFDYFEDEDGGEGYYKLRGMGGIVKFYDVISRTENGNTITYDVRYYSDPLQIGTARVVQYVIEKTDTIYGFKLLEVKELERTENEIFAVGL